MGRIILFIIFICGLFSVEIKAQQNNEDNIIYLKVFSEFFEKDFLKKRKNCLTISHEPVYPCLFGFDYYRELRELDSSLVSQLMTLNDTLTSSYHSRYLKKIFNEYDNVIIIDEAKLEELSNKGYFWNYFFKEYKCSMALIAVSAIAYNESGTKAFFYFESQIDMVAGSGCFVICEKRNNEWIVKNIVQVLVI